ncbi:hypothetical protein AAON49_02425 [Pseudotenacibaculum sp. MALMAid0570]|uniref:hypothetical protein n=1 Tax=Pseudotenacibaculum sp. MALMAid0570 TaxID=3143938 RepID=UPI0032DEE4C0
MLKRVFFIGCLFFVFSCDKKELTAYDKMKSDKLLSESFTDNQLKDLVTIVEFFENEICDKFNQGNKENLKSCYDKFNIQDTISFNKGEYLKFIDIESQREMYKKIDSSTLYEIWQKGRCYPDTLKIPVNIDIKAWGSRYYRFLEKVAKKDTLFKEYALGLTYANGVSISSTASLTMNYNLYNTSDIKVRLLYAINYLSVNENLDFRIKKPCL